MTAFSDDQKNALKAPLSKDSVKTREQGKSTVSYIEAWHAIDEANRIFGFDSWDRETVEARCVAERERKIGQGQYQRDGWGVTYTAKVRITVGSIIREGSGAGHGIDADLGLAHESALKEAESDAMKRALMTFGNPFGLALYDKSQVNVVDGQGINRREAIDSLWSELALIKTLAGLQSFWGDNHDAIRTMDEVNKRRFTEKKEAMKRKLSSKPGTVKDIEETFPGSRVVNETVREQSVLEAGE